ncbi:FadR family transcriptional regulator [bacterium]|nr:FadR family transcriptional regulator [bacterium]
MPASIFARPLTRSKLSGEIENILLKGIIGGRLKSGDKLPAERDLAHELDVNRSTVRAALGKLESLDLIEIRHGDGVYVKDHLRSRSLELTRSMIRLDEQLRDKIISNALEFRTIIGPEMARLAARNRTDEHLLLLHEVIWKKPELTVLERDIEVHHIIALASDNILYLVLLNYFNKFVEEYGFLYFDHQKNCERSTRFHEDIFRAITDHDEKRAVKIMAEVLKYAEDAVAETLNAGKE